MKSKRIAILCLLLGGFYTSRAQNLEESLLFSQNEQGATARFKAMGNAQTSLGGDLSNISGNPAGLGFFNSSDIGFSLDYFGDRNRATYFGNATTSTADRVGINQLGIVFNLPNMRARGSGELDRGWLNFNVGIGYTKTNSFHSKLNYAGINPNTSIADFFVDQAYEGSFLGDVGWDMGLYDQVGQNNPYYAMTSLDNDQGVMNAYSGTQSEVNFSVGANYSNRFYLGASLGISSVSYNANTHFYEDGFIAGADNLQDPGPGEEPSRFLTDAGYNELLNSAFSYDQQMWSRTRGTGVNLKLGAIYRASDVIRVGLSATTPTWYRMSDNYDDFYGIANFNANGGEISSYEDATYDNYGEYNLRTPYRINGGISAVFNRGLISADVEFVDHKSIRLSNTDNLLEMQFNDNVAANYQGALNYKVGGELMIIPEFLLRAGYNRQGNPYQNADYKAQSFTGGLGFRFGNYYVDATYQHWRQEYSAAPYTFTEEMDLASPIADVRNSRNNVFLTIGAKF